MRSAVIGLILLTAATSSAQTSAGTKSSSAAKSSAAPSSQPSGDVSLERIRDGVMRESRITLPDFGVPTYRVEVTQPTIKLPGQYDSNNPGAMYVRGPYYSNWHQDFLDMSSPTGRPSQLAGGGLPVLDLISGLKKHFREREAARIKAQVQDEMQQIDPERFRPTSTSSRPPQD